MSSIAFGEAVTADDAVDVALNKADALDLANGLSRTLLGSGIQPARQVGQA
jgi:hypothetical protein